ncbi:MAG: hypothetical protein LBH04_11755 [Tannerellaceae bacterium]|nr:hypothetical protein [Tannerellaceae bacterium]
MNHNGELFRTTAGLPHKQSQACFANHRQPHNWTVGNSRLYSRQPTTGQSPTHDWAVANPRLYSRQPTTGQSATHNWAVANPQLGSRQPTTGQSPKHIPNQEARLWQAAETAFHAQQLRLATSDILYL